MGKLRRKGLWWLMFGEVEFHAVDWMNVVRVVIASSMSSGDFNFILRFVLFESSSLNVIQLVNLFIKEG